MRLFSDGSTAVSGCLEDGDRRIAYAVSSRSQPSLSPRSSTSPRRASSDPSRLPGGGIAGRGFDPIGLIEPAPSFPTASASPGGTPSASAERYFSKAILTAGTQGEAEEVLMCSCQGLVVKYQMISRNELDKRMRPNGASYRQEQLMAGGGRLRLGQSQPATPPRTCCLLSGDRNYLDEHTSRTDDLFSTERLAETLFKLADVDGDQTVTKEELTSAITQHPELCELWPEFKMEGDELFRLIDTDNSNSISLDELKCYFKKLEPSRKEVVPSFEARLRNTAAFSDLQTMPPPSRVQIYFESLDWHIIRCALMIWLSVSCVSLMLLVSPVHEESPPASPMWLPW